jgi:hypothetical protein
MMSVITGVRSPLNTASLQLRSLFDFSPWSRTSSPTSPPFGFIERVFTADILYKFLLILIYFIIYFKFDISLSVKERLANFNF